MIFRDKQHEEIFNEIYNRMRTHDCYYKPVAYLIALDTVCREHIEDIFDFEEHAINPDCLVKGWQTSTSLRTCRLAFNLYNGYCYDDEEEQEPSSNYTPDSLFCTGYAPYYWQAIKLRYPEFTEE